MNDANGNQVAQGSPNCGAESKDSLSATPVQSISSDQEPTGSQQSKSVRRSNIPAPKVNRKTPSPRYGELPMKAMSGSNPGGNGSERLHFRFMEEYEKASTPPATTERSKVIRARDSPHSTGFEESPSSADRRVSGPKSLSGSKLTIPRAPRLQTPRVNKQELNKEDPYTMAQGLDMLKKGLRKSPPASVTRQNHITLPQAPKFHQLHRGRDQNERSTNDHIPMAQSVDVLKKELRSSPPAESMNHSHGESKLTVPRAPVFGSAHQRPLPKSQDELEMEIMQQVTPFKANSMPDFAKYSAHQLDSPTVSQKSVTTVEPFHFHSEERATHHKKPEPSIDKETLDLKECEKQFKARPMPEKFKRDTHGDSSVASITKSTASPQELTVRPFKARPLPLTTYISPEHQKSPAISPLSQCENSADVVIHGINLLGNDVQHQQIGSPQPGDDNSSQTRQKLEEYKKQKEEQRRQEQEVERQRREFRARPLPKSIRQHQKQQKQHATDEEKAFVQLEKLRQEQEEERKRREFRARPLPKSGWQEPKPESLGESHDSPADQNVRITGRRPEEMKNVSDKSLKSTTDLLRQFDQMQRMKEDTVKDLNSLSTRHRSLTSNNETGSNNAVSQESRQPEQSPRKRVLSGHSIRVFVYLCIFRVINTFFIQSYFDPDEYWQMLEPAYCETFVPHQECPGYTWDWRRRSEVHVDSVGGFITSSMLGPVRSYLSVLPTYILYRAAQFFGFDTSWMIARGPMILNAILFAAPVDWCVWYIARWLEPKIADKHSAGFTVTWWCLFCNIGSWFNAYSLVRTYSNSQETCLLTLALALLAPELIGNKEHARAAFRYCIAFFIGGVSVSIRCTSLMSYVAMGVLLAERRQTFLRQIAFLLCPCALFGALGVGVAMMVDRQFYGFWTVPFLGNIHFNVILGYATLYGIHSWHWYFTGGIAAISGLLFPFLLLDLCKVASITYGRRNLWLMVVTYLTILSVSAHKEFRFMQPVLPLVCLLVGTRLHSMFDGMNSRTARFCRSLGVTIFVFVNLVALLYLGLLHQAAPISVNRKILEVAQTASGSSTTYSVYYWTGACHSTALNSHLHSPPLSFETWSLDCSPSCRSDPNGLCEYERFSAHPLDFVAVALCQIEEREDRVCEARDGEEEVCSVVSTVIKACPDARPIPDFVVTRSVYEGQIRHELGRLGLQEIGRFVYSIKAARLGNRIFGAEAFLDTTYRHVHFSDLMGSLFDGSLPIYQQGLYSTAIEGGLSRLSGAGAEVFEVAVDEMILFSKVA